MKNIFGYALWVLLFSVSTISAQKFLNESRINFTNKNLTEGTISSKIIKEQQAFTHDQVVGIKEQCRAHNALVNKKIEYIRDGRLHFVDLHQQLTQKQGVVTLFEQVREFENKHEEIKLGIKENLETIAYRGMFIYVKKNLPAFGVSKTKSTEEARHQITPNAVHKVRGSFITSISEVSNNDGSNEIFTYIKEEIQGEVKPVTSESKLIPNEKLFTYVGVLDVYPLKSGSKGTGKSRSSGGSKSDFIVIDAMEKSSVIRSKLKNFGIKDSRIDKILSYASTKRSDVNFQNKKNKSREATYINEGAVKLQEIEGQIVALNKKIDQTHLYLETFLARNTNVVYDRENSERSIALGKQFLINKVKRNSDLELILKEKILKEKWFHPVPITEGSVDEIAKSAYAIINQLNSELGKVEIYDQTKELENNEFTQSETSKVSYDRKVDRVWLYLISEDSGYSLSVVTTFKILGPNNRFLYPTNYFEDIESEFLTGFVADENSVLTKPKVIAFAGSEVTNVPVENEAVPDTQQLIPAEEGTMEEELRNKTEEFDKEVAAVKASRGIDAQIKKYKKKRGFQRTLMYISLAAGGYFGYAAFAAKGDYDDATDPDEAAGYREDVEMNSNIAYGCLGLATYNIICSGIYSKKIKKLENSKMSVGVIANDRFSGLSLSYAF